MCVFLCWHMTKPSQWSMVHAAGSLGNIIVLVASGSSLSIILPLDPNEDPDDPFPMVQSEPTDGFRDKMKSSDPPQHQSHGSCCFLPFWDGQGLSVLLYSPLRRKPVWGSKGGSHQPSLLHNMWNQHLTLLLSHCLFVLYYKGLSESLVVILKGIPSGRGPGEPTRWLGVSWASWFGRWFHRWMHMYKFHWAVLQYCAN